MFSVDKATQQNYKFQTNNYAEEQNQNQWQAQSADEQRMIDKLTLFYENHLANFKNIIIQKNKQNLGLQNKIQELEFQIHQLSQDLEITAKNLKNQQVECREIEQKYQTLFLKTQNEMEKTSEQEYQFDEMEKQINQLMAGQRAQEIQIQNSENDLQKIMTEKDQLEKENYTLTCAKSDLERQIAKLNIENANAKFLESNNNKQYQTILMLQQQLKDMEGVLKNNRDLQASNNHLVQENQRLKQNNSIFGIQNDRPSSTHKQQNQQNHFQDNELASIQSSVNNQVTPIKSTKMNPAVSHLNQHQRAESVMIGQIGQYSESKQDKSQIQGLSMKNVMNWNENAMKDSNQKEEHQYYHQNQNQLSQDDTLNAIARVRRNNDVSQSLVFGDNQKMQISKIKYLRQKKTQLEQELQNLPLHLKSAAQRKRKIEAEEEITRLSGQIKTMSNI